MTDLASTTTIRPAFDPEVEGPLDQLRAVNPPLSDEGLAATRRAADEAPRPDYTADGAVVVTEHTAPGPSGAPDIALTVLTPTSGATGLPVIYNIHGGGLVMGNRYMYLDELVPYVAQEAAVVVSVGYRFAPEHRAPAQVEDCYAGLLWTAEHAEEIGGDASRIMVMGVSAGGGLALGVSLLARDRKGPKLTHQVLVAPMLDDRLDTPSHYMLDDYPSGRNDMIYAWSAALGEARGGAEVSAYVAPARATDLSGLPRTYLDVGSTEGFRDEVLIMGMRLSQAGVGVDLHLWGGGCHGFYYIAPNATVSREARATRAAFIARALAV